jgi:hypothetical protein
MSLEFLYGLPRDGWRIDVFPDRQSNAIIFNAHVGDHSERFLSLSAAISWLYSNLHQDGKHGR